MRFALLLLVAWPLPAPAQGPVAIADYRAALADAPADATLRKGLADARAEVAYPPGLAPPVLAGARHAVSPLDLLVLSVASALAVAAGGVGHKLRPRSGAAVAACGVAGWAVTLALAAVIEVERRDERPPAVVSVAATLRGGNGPNFPPRWPTPLPPGVEGVALHRRGGWVQVALNDGSAGGLVGWLPEGAVIGVADATRIRP